MMVGLHPHLMGLYHSPRSLAQLGVTEQLDSGIYLLYQKKIVKILRHCAPL